MYNTSGATLIRCVINGNSASASGLAGTSQAAGGGLYSGGTFINCEIRGNTASGVLSANGGGTFGGFIFINCLVAENHVSFSGIGSSGSGGGVLSNSANMFACTVVNNTLSIAQGMSVGGTTAGVLKNCIVFGNTGPEVAGSAMVSASCIDGGFAGSGNISADPLFVNPALHDYHLRAGSPCRDAGDRTMLPHDKYNLDGDNNTVESLPRDLDLHRRIVNGQVDMGAYEWQRTCLPDISPSSPGVAGNGVVDIDDLLSVINGWGACDQCSADVNDDDTVNIDDLLAVINGWGLCQH